MNKRGFTLIELLAIIVILAVIAVITVPIILGIIEEAKIKSVTDSVYGYRDGVLNYDAQLRVSNETNNGLQESYTVEELKTAGLKVNGQEPNSGIVLIDNKGISGCIQYDEYASYLYNNDIINTVKATCPTQKLTTTGDGLYESTTEPGRMVFKGQNPNNRILLSEDGTNNTLYRIVSYETDGTIKVVRDEKLPTDMPWDGDGARKNSSNTFCQSTRSCNAWAKGSDTYHNGEPLGDNYSYFYYSSTSSTDFSSDITGTVSANSTLNTYLNNTWLSTTLSNYIETHSWNVGGIYTATRANDEEEQLTWNGKVALLSAEEFVESSINPECTTILTGAQCKESNWLFKTYGQWTLTVVPINSLMRLFVGGDCVYSVSNERIINGVVYTNYGVRPAFYLKAGLSISGTGATNDEYTID